MKVTPDNQEWAVGKLLDFAGWRGFPQTDGDLKRCARAFLHLVHNKPIGEVMADSRAGLPPIEIDWAAKGIDPDQNDAEWILDQVAETMDYFPLPVQLRDMYTAHLPPAANLKDHSVRPADTETRSVSE